MNAAPVNASANRARPIAARIDAAGRRCEVRPFGVAWGDPVRAKPWAERAQCPQPAEFSVGTPTLAAVELCRAHAGNLADLPD